MKIVNLNEYDENDGLKNKLRQRMDTHEPELSDSVWDRIHHEMDRKEANRKKRFLWWFSSVAVVVLTSGIITFLVLNNDAKPSEVVVQNTNEIIFQTKPNTTSEAEIALPENATSTDIVADGENSSTLPSTTAPSNTITVTTVPTNLVPPVPTNNQPDIPATPNENGGAKNTETGDGNTNDKSNPTKNRELEVVPQQTNPSEKENAIETDNKNLEGKNLEAKPDVSKKEVKKENKPKVKSQLKNRWFVGAMFSYNQTYRTVTDINASFIYPTAKNRDDYEKKSYSPSYGIELGFYPTKNFFVKSGVGMYNMSEIVEYDVKERQDTFIAPTSNLIYGDYRDSIATGNSTQKRNTYSYIQIPIEVGYSRDITNKWGLFVSGGVALNILRDYRYHFYESFYGNAVIPPGVEENYKDMYKSFVMLSGNIGGQYKITNRWVATLGINYRRAISSSADKKYEVNVKPYSIGATTGIAFRF